jgi:heat shock protein beta
MGRKLVRKAIELITKLAEYKDDEDDEDEEEGDEDEDETTDDTKKTTDSEGDEEKAKEKEKKKQAAIEKYNTFWKEFGKNIKLGIIEDSANRNKLAKVARWRSSLNSSAWISLDDYVSRKKENQNSIYYMGGEDKEVLMRAPAIQGLLKKEYEVLLLDDPIDEYCMQHLTEYGQLKLVNVAKGDFKLPSDDDQEKKKLKKLRKLYEPLTKWWRTVLKDYIEKVEISTRLVEDPALIVASEHGYSPNMERISRAQAYSSSDKQSPFASSKRILEINPSHPIIKELLERVKDNPDSPDQYTADMATLLYESALLNSGYAIHDVSAFSKKFYKVFNGALGIPQDAKVEEIEIDLDDDEEEPKASSGSKDEEEVNLDADSSHTEKRGDDEL